MGGRSPNLGLKGQKGGEDLEEPEETYWEGEGLPGGAAGRAQGSHESAKTAGREEEGERNRAAVLRAGKCAQRSALKVTEMAKKGGPRVASRQEPAQRR